MRKATFVVALLPPTEGDEPSYSTALYLEQLSFYAALAGVPFEARWASRIGDWMFPRGRGPAYFVEACW